MDNRTPLSRRGQVQTLNFQSPRLADNPLGDPSTRQLAVYLPAAYNNRRYQQRRFPVLFDLAGYTGSGLGHVNWANFSENLPQRLDRLIHQRKMPPCIVVFPDCFTALGGNQYINSSAIGNYADYLTKELIPFVDGEFRTHADRQHRGCFGKSSGGYGAMLHGMKYTRYWGAVANHSGDAYFDFIYKAEWPAVLTALQRYAAPALQAGENNPAAQAQPGEDDGRVQRFLRYCRNSGRLSGMDITVLMMLCMAATYDPDPDASNGFRLPYDLHTGAFLPQRWRRWLRHDPIHLVSRYRDNLRSLRGLYMDCGWRDQYHIHFGCRQLAILLRQQGIKHRYEEFNGTHSGIDYRMDVSLPFLARCLS